MATKNDDAQVFRAVVAGVAMDCTLDDAVESVAERFHLDAEQTAQTRRILGDKRAKSDLIVLRAVMAGVAMMTSEGCSVDDAAQRAAERFHLDDVQTAQARRILARRAELDAR